MSEEIQKADPRLRLRILILLTVVAAFGALGILYLHAYLARLHDLGPHLQPLAATRTVRAAHVFLAVLTGGALGLGLYLGWISRRVLASQRFPPPGHRVISDTRVRRGRQARRVGLCGLAFAALTVLLTAAVVWQANRLFGQLLDASLKPTIYVPAERPPPEMPRQQR